MTDRTGDLAIIAGALIAAGEVLTGYESGRIAVARKHNQDPVTEADLACDRILKEILLQPGEGWLSEETADDFERLNCARVWVVDPIDGTKEFASGIDEWCVSVGLVEDEIPVAGGIYNPAAGFLALGADGLGCTLNGQPACRSENSGLDKAVVLASRTEIGRGQWDSWLAAPFTIEAMGSVAYKMARVACGLAEATWTVVPKHEWDIAAGTALVRSVGGVVTRPDDKPLRFNQDSPWVPGLIVIGPGQARWFDSNVISTEVLSMAQIK